MCRKGKLEFILCWHASMSLESSICWHIVVILFVGIAEKFSDENPCEVGLTDLINLIFSHYRNTVLFFIFFCICYLQKTMHLLS